MKRRIGNDLGLEVAVKRNGRPEDLSALASLKVTVKSVYGAILPFAYSISGNVIKGVLFGKDQKVTGDYILEIVENENLDSQTVWDGYLLSLVDRTCKEDNEPLDISDSLDFEVEISVAKNGLSAYEIALSRGFVGTMDEWLESLGKPAEAAAQKAEEAAAKALQSAGDADKAAADARKAGEDAKQIAQSAGKEAREIAEGAASEAGSAAMGAQTATGRANAAAKSAEDASQEASTQAKNARKEAEKIGAALVQAESDHLRAETDHILAAGDRTDLEEVKGRVSGLEKIIPSQASEENKLADCEFVNSSIATATATFRGTFERIEDFPSDADQNDYAFLKTESSYDRYKWTPEGWVFEYSLNNSSFTQKQWDAINSGINAEILQELLHGGGTECTEEDILAIFQESDFSEDFNDDYGSNL